ncbi:MAG TPA: hypothetical protein VD978_34390 [Azospirillum sp.]|nr:hypothetical protein [Azospirillum sp.]
MTKTKTPSQPRRLSIDELTGVVGGAAISSGSGSSNNVYFSGDGYVNDTFSGGLGNDFLDGGLGDDSLSGEAGNDSLCGGDGDDTLDGGAGTDILDGGVGNDTIIVRQGEGGGFVSGGDGIDTLLIVGRGVDFRFVLSSGGLSPTNPPSTDPNNFTWEVQPGTRGGMVFTDGSVIGFENFERITIRR